MNSEPMRILIIKPSSLGDIVHTFPAAALLRAALPDAQLDWVANDKLAQMAGLFRGLHRVIHFPRQHLSIFKLGVIRNFVRDLQQDAYDAVIDFQGLLRSGLMAHFARTKLRIGFEKSRECAKYFYTHRVSYPDSIHHAAEKNLYLAKRALEIMGVALPKGEIEPQLEIPRQWNESADAFLSKHNLAANAPLLAVGCSSRWESKSWPPAFFAETLQLVAKECPELTIWLLGGSDERARAEEVVQHAQLSKLYNLAGETDLGALTALLARSKALLTNDSGPMHIAAALGVRCIACFGSTSAELTGPYGPAGRHVVLQSKCPQAPCFKRICPRGMNCPVGVTPADAATTVISVLNGR